MFKKIFKEIKNFKKKDKKREEEKSLENLNKLEDIWMNEFIKKIIITVLILLGIIKQSKEKNRKIENEISGFLE